MHRCTGTMAKHRRAQKNTRQRLRPPLGTVKGAELTERTRKFLDPDWRRQLMRERSPLPHLIWTIVLPGFGEAVVSSVEAILTCKAELEFWQLLAMANSPQQQAEIIALKQLKTGLHSAAEIFQRLSKASDPDLRDESQHRILRKASSATRHARDAKPVQFFADVEKYGVEVHGFSPAPEDVKTASVVQGKRGSIARELCAQAWVNVGLWLADSPGIVAWFAVQKQLRPEFNSIEVPLETTVRGWQSELGLKKYPGKGKLELDQRGVPWPTQELIAEVDEFCRSHPWGEKAKKYFEEFVSLTRRR